MNLLGLDIGALPRELEEQEATSSLKM